MEPISSAVIAAGALKLLSSAFSQAGGKAIEEFGKSAGGAAWGAAGRLYQAIKAKLAAKSEAQALDDLERSPADEKTAEQFRHKLEAAIEADTKFATEVQALLKETQSGGNNVFNFESAGVVVGEIHGDPSFSVAVPAAPPR